ncbi:hypothetical protein REPUB_Repub11eG0173700 [Reevesia pubescens]
MFLVISMILMLSMRLSSCAEEEDRKVYIAYLGSLPEGEYFPSSHHSSMLQAIFKQSSVENYLIRSYRRSFNGFAAKLTNEEAKKLASKKGVVSVFPSKVYHLQTTRSWDFMGFNETANRIGILKAISLLVLLIVEFGLSQKASVMKALVLLPKSGRVLVMVAKTLLVTSKHISLFKLVGARVYSQDSARDTVGHGTHTASTAAGNNVKGASFFGLAKGTARGGAPSARISAYKACNTDECASADVLAAFDDAIADGVDIITISIGPASSLEFYQDPIAIGSFHAAEKGIVVVQSAGNSGTSGKQAVGSVAPWILTVAASTTDRLFVDKVVLGNGENVTGFSINSFSLNRTKFPLVYGREAADEDCEEGDARACFFNCLNGSIVKDKIVLCDESAGLDEAYAKSAIGTIFPTRFDNLSFVVPLPASALSTDKFNAVKSYYRSTKKPEVEILRSETIEDSTAPLVAPFSSRGPNFIVPDILKPDISAPGVDILAAYSEGASPTTSLFAPDKRRVKYNIISGTSMSCPHIAGAAAYVKSFHPDWSPLAIKSALMTTAFPMDPTTNPDGEIAYGSGHVNLVKAINPGLIYDTVKGDYVRFLCSIGYGEGTIRQISGDNSSCPENSKNLLPRNFNYPSLTAVVSAGEPSIVNFHRTVANVGIARSTYNVKVSSNSKLEIKVIPEVLSFKSLKEKKSYNVTVTVGALQSSSMLSASLVWSDGSHSVRSPIVIHTYEGVHRAVSIP